MGRCPFGIVAVYELFRHTPAIGRSLAKQAQVDLLARLRKMFAEKIGNLFGYYEHM